MNIQKANNEWKSHPLSQRNTSKFKGNLRSDSILWNRLPLNMVMCYGIVAIHHPIFVTQRIRDYSTETEPGPVDYT